MSNQFGEWGKGFEFAIKIIIVGLAAGGIILAAIAFGIGAWLF